MVAVPKVQVTVLVVVVMDSGDQGHSQDLN